jgi:hypothetical protein
MLEPGERVAFARLSTGREWVGRIEPFAAGSSKPRVGWPPFPFDFPT